MYVLIRTKCVCITVSQWRHTRMYYRTAVKLAYQRAYDSC